MVIDLCYFNGEHEVFDVRYNILKPYVDKFIVCEARETFSGIPKELAFNIEKYPDVEYYILQETTDLLEMARKSPNTAGGEHYWVREFAQKEDARNALLMCNDNDFVFISDVDEIWNPALHYDPLRTEIIKPKQLPYLYYFNQRTDEDWLGWTGTICTRYENIKKGIINHLRTDTMNYYTVFERGGWHFNAIGGKEKKVEAFKHPVYYDEGVWNNREINMRKDESVLPEYILNNKDKWKKLLLA